MTEITNLRVLLIVDVQKCFLDGNLGIQGEKEVLEGGYSREEYLEVDIDTPAYKLIKELVVNNTIDLYSGYKPIYKQLSDLNTEGLPSRNQLRLILGRIKIEIEEKDTSLSLRSLEEDSVLFKKYKDNVEKFCSDAENYPNKN